LARRGVLDRVRQREITFGDAAGVVRAQRACHAIPGDRQIGVMVELIRKRRNGVDERDRSVEILAVVGLLKRIAAPLPAGERLQRFTDSLLTRATQSKPRSRSSPKDAAIAASVRSISTSPCSLERNMTSFCDGASRTPRARIA
jgi:hypothetical protein